MNVLSNRTMSSFPLSIGTGLALESVFENTIDRYDSDRVIPNRIDINEYRYHVFNIFTIARNILNSVPNKDKDNIIASKEFLTVLLEEISVLETLYSDTKCQPVIFIPNYKTVYSSLNKGKDTGITKSYVETEKMVNTIKKIEKELTIATVKDSYKLPSLNGNVLITTSYTNDLLINLKNYTLLESHTGKLKSKYEFNTKYHKLGKKDILMIPFYEELLYILGDNYLVRPMKLTLRLELRELAIANDWTPRTTREKVLYDLKKSEKLSEALKGYKKIY
jgi:hypothetical protein